MIEPGLFLAHWQGHRRLSARVLAAFPEDQLFTFAPAAPLRPFGELLWEIVGQTGYVLDGLGTGTWGEPRWERLPSTAPGVLRAAWEAQTARIGHEGARVPPSRWAAAQATGWGEMTAVMTALAALDNEIHHRGQGTIYLRLLGIAPPDFWERG